jgi:hypothetical protein
MCSDHVVPFHSPEGTVAEWMEDPFGLAGYVYTGPGKKRSSDKSLIVD